MLTPLKAIRAKCLDCSAGQANEVKLCPCTDCSLYPYRFGRGIKKSCGRIYSEEEKKEIVRRLKEAKAKKLNAL